MGTFKVDVEIANVSKKPMQWRSFRGLLVDTGSEATWLPEDELKKLGLTIFKKDQAFVMANGQVITRDLGIALIKCGEFKTVDEVVFAKEGDFMLLGARTLEGFHAHVDSRGKRLVASGPLPAAQIRVQHHSPPYCCQRKSCL